MSEQDKTGTEQGVEQNGEKERPAHRGTFPTLEAAQAVTPPSEKWREFLVTDGDGQKVYTWGQSVESAIVNAARAAGYKAEVAVPKGAGPLTKEKIGAALAAMSPEDAAILIRQYVPAPVDSPAPGKGKGKK